MLRSRRPTGAISGTEMATALGTALERLGAAVPLQGIGIDVVDVVEFEHNFAIGGVRWLRKLFCEEELVQCDFSAQRLAARFAAKEAVVKALGTGFRDGVAAREIAILTGDDGRPGVELHGVVAVTASAAGVGSVLVSTSREGNCAAAVAVTRTHQRSERSETRYG